MTNKEHKKESYKINAAILTISDSRTQENDESGSIIKNILNNEIIEHSIIKDNKDEIKDKIMQLTENNDINLIITNGGTGIAKKDLTIEAIKPLFEKELTSFNTLFTNLSHQEIGPSAFLSRATAGIIKGKVIFCLPGSPNACKLALEKLILPEINHLIKHLRE